jgi:hypothetical protein
MLTIPSTPDLLSEDLAKTVTTYSITFDPTSRQGIKSHRFHSNGIITKPLEANEAECTEEQFLNYKACFLADDGKTITISPNAILQLAKDTQIEILKSKCQQSIVGGFTSSVLGTIHLYGSNTTDQLNLSKQVMLAAVSEDPIDILCADTSGSWEFRPHTPKQVIQLAQDESTFISTQRQKLSDLRNQVSISTSVVSVQQVDW